MAAPACNRYNDALSQMKELLATEKAAGNLRRYLSSYGGAQFDRLTDRLVLDESTPADFKAVRELRVSVLIRPVSGPRRRPRSGTATVARLHPRRSRYLGGSGRQVRFETRTR